MFATQKRKKVQRETSWNFWVAVTKCCRSISPFMEALKLWLNHFWPRSAFPSQRHLNLLDGADFEISPTNKIPPERRLISFCPTCSLLLPWQASPTVNVGSEAATPVVSTPHRLRTCEIPKLGRCLRAWWWRLLTIICLHCLPRLASFDKTGTNPGKGNYLNFCTSRFCNFGIQSRGLVINLKVSPTECNRDLRHGPKHKYSFVCFFTCIYLYR